jgi:hypothetical protein
MEYWPPFAVLFTAFTLQAVWDNKNTLPPRRSPRPGEKRESVSTKPEQIGRSKDKADEASWRALHIVLVVILLIGALFYNLRTARTKISSVTTDPDHYRAGAEWLRTNVPPGSLIYDVNWSDFPKLFFYDAGHSYVSGLDAIYLQDQHPELARLNDRLSSGLEVDPATAIRSLFAATNPGGVSYLFVGDLPTPPASGWFGYMMKTGQFKKVYSDHECVILQLLDTVESTTPSALVSPQQKSTWNTPDQRKTAADEVHRRFGDDIYGTAEEDFEGAPALVVHNKHATEEWATSLLETDGASIRGEALWQLGFRKYVVTNGKHGWVADVEGNEKYRAHFNDGPEPEK